MSIGTSLFPSRKHGVNKALSLSSKSPGPCSCVPACPRQASKVSAKSSDLRLGANKMKYFVKFCTYNMLKTGPPHHGYVVQHLPTLRNAAEPSQSKKRKTETLGNNHSRTDSNGGCLLFQVVIMRTAVSLVSTTAENGAINTGQRARRS